MRKSVQVNLEFGIIIIIIKYGFVWDYSVIFINDFFCFFDFGNYELFL